MLRFMGSQREFDSVGARNIPERLRLTKAVLQSKDIGCGFAPGTSPILPQPAPSRARTLEAGKRLKVPWTAKEIRPISLKGNQP